MRWRLQTLICGRLLQYLGQLLSKLVQFLLQGCALRVRGGHLVPDLTDLRLDPCGHDHADGSARCNVGPLQGHTVTQQQGFKPLGGSWGEGGGAVTTAQ